jgi:hypothetical protein
LPERPFCLKGPSGWPLAALFLVWFLLGSAPAGWGQNLRPGAEVFALDPGLVLEVSYRTNTVRLLAHRWQKGEPFTLAFWEKGRAQPAVCPAGAGFARVLRQLTSLRLRRTLTAPEAAACFRDTPLSTWPEVVLRDTSALEPFRALLLPRPGSTSEALVHFNGVTCLVDFDPQIFRLLAGGCQTLARPEASKTNTK